MTQQRKITDEADARRCLAAARGASQSVGRWAQANGVDGRSLNAWRMNLARRGVWRGRSRPRSAAAQMVRRAAIVELVPAPVRVPTRDRYLLHVGEHRLELDRDFDPATLRRLIEVLRAC